MVVAALPAFLEAMLALLLLLVLLYVTMPIWEQAAQNIGGPIGWGLQVMGDELQFAVNHYGPWLEGMVEPFVSTVWAHINGVGLFIQNVDRLGWATLRTTYWLVHTAIPRAASETRVWAWAQLQTAAASLSNDYRHLYNTVSAYLAVEVKRAKDAENWVLRTLTLGLAGENVRAKDAERAVHDYATQQVQSAKDQAAKAEAYLGQQEQADARALHLALSAQAASLTRLIQSDVHTLERDLAHEHAISRDFTNLRAGQVLASAAAATAVVAEAVRALENSPCIQRCNVLGALGAELENLDLMLILGLAAEAAHDPQAVAGFFREQVMPLVNEGEQILKGVLNA